MKIFSTFSGIGGFEIGIERAALSVWNGKTENTITETSEQGMESTSESVRDNRNITNSELGGNSGTVSCVGYSEIDRYAIKVYEKQFGGECENCRLARERERDSGTSGRQETLNSERTRLPQTVRDNDNTKNERSESDRTTCEHTPKNFGDITKINAKELPDFDCLVGGFPCQAFSIAGKRRGFDDTRGTLFFDLARILREKQPRYFVFENVKGLLSHDQGNTFRTIIATIDELGYDCQWSVLNSKNFGVPQNRERVYIVGHLRGTPRPEVFPLSGSDSENNQPNEGRDSNILPTLRATHYKSGDNQPVIAIGTLRTHKDGNGQPVVIAAQRGRYNEHGEIEQQLEPRFDGVSNTLTAVQKDNMLYKPQIRRLTPLECERLQGFPDNWTAEGIDGAISDTQRYKMCGNAVTTNVVQAVFEKILL